MARPRCTGRRAVNDLDAARLLVRAGAKAKTANRYGSTPLELAAVNGSAAMIEVLLEAGADPNAALPEGRDGPDDRGADREAWTRSRCCSRTGPMSTRRRGGWARPR